MASKFISSASFLAAVTLGGAAVAGGYSAPVVAPIPVVVTPPVETSDWAGAYFGGSLGYTFGGDDVIGMERYGDAVGNPVINNSNDLGEVDVKGVNAGLHAGYRWQRNNWVYGPEIGIEGGSVDADDTIDVFGEENVLESTVNYIASLRFKTGYVVNPKTLVYGTVGAAYGDFDYSLAPTSGGAAQEIGYDDVAWTAGLGVERKLNEKLSMFAEWEFRGFSKTAIDFAARQNLIDQSQATPEHHNIKVGVNYRF